ncbi:MAG TPA: hypothetical protein PLY87_05795 [Planctomycetaceae bacterium]|nr:hypothetical protein [Planctomycetaceae bacterium]
MRFRKLKVQKDQVQKSTDANRMPATPSIDELEILLSAEKQMARALPQKGDQFEIATCGTICRLAESPGYDDALK